MCVRAAERANKKISWLAAATVAACYSLYLSLSLSLALLPSPSVSVVCACSQRCVTTSQQGPTGGDGQCVIFFFVARSLPRAPSPRVPAAHSSPIVRGRSCRVCTYRECRGGESQPSDGKTTASAHLASQSVCVFSSSTGGNCVFIASAGHEEAARIKNRPPGKYRQVLGSLFSRRRSPSADGRRRRARFRFPSYDTYFFSRIPARSSAFILKTRRGGRGGGRGYFSTSLFTGACEKRRESRRIRECTRLYEKNSSTALSFSAARGRLLDLPSERWRWLVLLLLPLPPSKMAARPRRRPLGRRLRLTLIRATLPSYPGISRFAPRGAAVYI